MIKVKIYTIGKTKESWLLEALAEYEKRLQGTMQIEWLLAKDDNDLAKWALADPNFIALDVQGQLLSSENFSQKLFQSHSRLSFVIGGAEGLPPPIKKSAKWLWSLSPLTFTHQMTRLILLEQLYRAAEIHNNGPYHK